MRQVLRLEKNLRRVDCMRGKKKGEGAWIRESVRMTVRRGEEPCGQSHRRRQGVSKRWNKGKPAETPGRKARGLKREGKLAMTARLLMKISKPLEMAGRKAKGAKVLEKRETILSQPGRRILCIREKRILQRKE